MQEILKLADEFKQCQKTLLALGDANRQHLILEMMQLGECNGVRVGTITKKTKNYYYFDADTDAMDQLVQMLIHAKRIMESLPDRSE